MNGFRTAKRVVDEPGQGFEAVLKQQRYTPLARCAIWAIAMGSHVLADPSVDTLGGRFPPLIVHCLSEVEVLFPSADGSTLCAVDDGGTTGCRPIPHIFRLERPPSGLPARTRAETARPHPPFDRLDP
jgi:hypothetical protein